MIFFNLKQNKLKGFHTELYELTSVPFWILDRSGYIEVIVNSKNEDQK